ncbi:hypothetical protein TWF281_007222 [Arthrobotrys megalospora]
MTSPLVNIFVTPGLYVAPEDAIGSNPPEQCGGPNRYCYLAPGNLTGVCGTWLNLPDHCCWVAAKEGNIEGVQSCDTVAGVQDTPFDRIGSSDAFNATGSTCPSGNYEFYEYDTEQGGTISACCPNGQTGQVFLITSNTDATQYFLDGIRCGTFEVFGELENPTMDPMPSSTSDMESSATSAPGTSRGGSTSQPPTSITQAGTGSASATGGQATTTSGSVLNKPSKMAYLIVGSVLFGLFFGGSL